MSFYYNDGNKYLHVNKTEICKFETHYKILFYRFCLWSVSKDFTKDEQSEISLNCTVDDFLVDHSSMEKEDILNNHKCLMIEYNIK